MLKETISAGDVGRYAFCALNWKRSLEGEAGAGGEEGMRAHAEAAKWVDALELFQARAKWSLQSSFLLALFAISGASLALELLYLDFGTPLQLGLVVLTVSWLMGSLYLFLFDMYFRGRAEELVRAHRIVPGEVQYADTPKGRTILRSRVLPLQGTPDYVVRVEGASVPVEMKTGKTPPRPYASHVMQLAAYCYLVGEESGVRPPHGVLQYPRRSFDVPYTQQVQDDLLKTILRIQLAQRTGDVHRDHENPRRCAACSRREGCPERLA